MIGSAFRCDWLTIPGVLGRYFSSIIGTYVEHSRRISTAYLEHSGGIRQHVGVTSMMSPLLVDDSLSIGRAFQEHSPRIVRAFWRYWGMR